MVNIYIIALFTIWLPSVFCQDCSQYTRDECLLKHIDGCADPSSCTKDSNAGKSKSKQQNPESDTETGGGGGGGGGDSVCFHGDGLVYTDQGRLMKIGDIAVAGPKSKIKVLSRNDSGMLIFSPIDHWLHAEPEKEQMFLLFKTEHGQQLSLTKNHLIYRTDCANGSPEAVLADRLQPGQCALVVADSSHQRLIKSRIISRKSEIKRGIYAPITTQGNLVVDNVLVSCFTSLENEALQKIMYHYLSIFYRLTQFIMSFFGDVTIDNTEHAVPEVIFSFWDLSRQFVSQ